MGRSYRYILRYQIDPLHQAEERLEELVSFCAAAGIGEVMLFIAPEELSCGHATREEVEAYIPVARRLKARLADEGVALSLNPWSTLYHLARGRQLRPGQEFTRMVGETGAADPVAACPLCPAWQAYLCEIFALLAREIEPVAIWVEDDWRLHNHAPELGWGGCFCQLHLERFAARVGRTVTRQEVLARVLAPGEPDAWRGMWLDLSRDSLLEPARRLRQAVTAANPKVRLGLMGSSPDAHSIEGRDWPALQEALGREPAFLVRPHLPPYTEEPALQAPPCIARLTLAHLQGPLEIYPELENSPRCGRYSKSATQSVWECYEAAAMGSAGIAIDHYDLMGNGLSLDRGFGRYLVRTKAKLDALASLGLDDGRAEGARVLYSPDAARHRRTSATTSISMGGLAGDSTVWAQVLSILGIAHGFARDVDVCGDGSAAERPVLAAAGQTLWAFADADIERLLAGPAVLDAEATDIMVQRGYGKQIGVQRAAWKSLSEARYAYESLAAAEPEVYGLARPRLTAQRCAARLLDMEPGPGTRPLSTVCGPDGSELFPGALVCANDRGGRIACLTYPFDGGAQFFMGFFNPFRRIMLQRLFMGLAPTAAGAMAEEHPLFVYRTALDGGTFLAVLNPTLDAVERVAVRVPAGRITAAGLRMLTADGEWVRAPATMTAGELWPRLAIEASVPSLEGLFLVHGDGMQGV